MYISLQGFVIFVTMCREALDDLRRFRRDYEVNGQQFLKLTRAGLVKVPSSDIQVSDLIVVEKVGFVSYRREISACLFMLLFHFVLNGMEMLRSSSRP